MYYISWCYGDDFNPIEIIGEKNEPDEKTRQRAIEKYKEIASTPGVSKIKSLVQTIDVKFSDRDDARVYTYFCDVDQVAFAKICAIKRIPGQKRRLICPKQWNGLNFIDEFGNPKKFYFEKAEYKDTRTLQRKAEEICKVRRIKYTGNLLQVFVVFHA